MTSLLDLGGGPRGSVADNPYAVGHASASQLSRDYRRAYALPPRRDVARLAATPALTG